MSTKKPEQMLVYVVLDAVRQAPDALEIPAGYAPLAPIGSYKPFPGGPKGARVWTVTDGPITDTYSGHFVACADMDYSGEEPVMRFEPLAQRMFEIISKGLAAESLGKELVRDVLKRVGEVVVNESQAAALAWIADQDRKVARSV